MGNKSQNDDYFEKKDIYKIRQNYLKYKEQKLNSDMNYTKLSSILYTAFSDRYNALFKEKELKEIKEKLKKNDKEENVKELTKINEIINEGELLEKKAFDDFCFYHEFFYNVERKYESYSIKKETYNKICEDVIDSLINTLLKFEKELIIIMDKIKQL